MSHGAMGGPRVPARGHRVELGLRAAVSALQSDILRGKRPETMRPLPPEHSRCHLAKVSLDTCRKKLENAKHAAKMLASSRMVAQIPNGGGRLADATEATLIALADEQRRRDLPAVGIHRLAALSGVSEAECWKHVRELERQGLARGFDAGPGRSLGNAASVTKVGKAVTDLSVVPPLGPVGEFLSGIDGAQSVALDTVVERQLRFAGGSATRSEVRAAIRRAVEPKLDVATAHQTIDRLALLHLTSLGGDDPSYGVTLAGLLASSWGTNALEVISGAMEFLRDARLEERRYSWSAFRSARALPHGGLNLAYVALTLAKLGISMHDDEDQYWWTTPPDLDLALEVNSALEYVRGIIGADGSNADTKLNDRHDAKGNSSVTDDVLPSPVLVDQPAYEYDVALSFAGEDRHLVQPIADRLKTLGIRVFYDDDEQADLWGKDLPVHFHGIYSRRARYCMIFASANYVEKMWTAHERQAAQERALRERGREYILPIRIDGTEIPGLSSARGHVALGLGPERICDLLVQKLSAIAPVGRPAPSATQVGAAPSPALAATGPSPSTVPQQVIEAPPPFALVPHVPTPVTMGRGVVPGALALMSETEAPDGPIREVVVVPYDLRPAAEIKKAEAIQRARELQARGLRGSALFPIGPLEDPRMRDPRAVLWDEKPRFDWHAQFALGFDGSLAHREFISETRRNSPIWGSGVGLFSTLDRVVGAVVFAQRFSRVGVRWLVVTLDQIRGQSLAFDYNGEEPMAAHIFAGRSVTKSETIRIALNFDAAIDESGVVRLALVVGEELAFYFAWQWREEWVISEVQKTVASVLTR